MDVRKETFGRVILIGRGFYDEAVQKVLCKRRTIATQEILDLAEEQFHLAWPLLVFGWINTLQNLAECQPSKPIWGEATNVLDCYRVDPAFTSELLLVVTTYAELNPAWPLNTPEKLTLEQALMEYEDFPGNPDRPDYYLNVILSEEEMAGASPAINRVLPGYLADWKTIAAKIKENHPHLENVVKADSLKAYFHKEKKRRERIYKLWSANMNAYWGMPPYYGNNLNNLTLFSKYPEGPNLNLYPKSSVTSTHR